MRLHHVDDACACGGATKDKKLFCVYFGLKLKKVFPFAYGPEKNMDGCMRVAIALSSIFGTYSHNAINQRK